MYNMRYIKTSERLNLLKDIANENGWSTDAIGQTKNGLDLFVFRNRPDKRVDICAWSLMHGNEPTGFNALLSLMQRPNTSISWSIFPVVNPNGADLFKRLNADALDINRDARNLNSIEGLALSKWVLGEKPSLALNLHDQRTCFYPKGKDVPASFSLLAPKGNRDYETTSQTIAMNCCSWMINELKGNYPEGVGKFDDSFYPSAFGEYFQENNIPTITIETGIGLNDWARIEVSKSLGELLFSLDKNFQSALSCKLKSYQKLPQNVNNAQDWICITFAGPYEIRVMELVENQKYSRAWKVVGPGDLDRKYWFLSESISTSVKLTTGQILNDDLVQFLGGIRIKDLDVISFSD